MIVKCDLESFRRPVETRDGRRLRRTVIAGLCTCVRACVRACVVPVRQLDRWRVQGVLTCVCEGCIVHPIESEAATPGKLSWR